MKIPGQEAISSIKKLYRLFNQKQQKAFKWLIFFTFIGSATDLIGLSFIIPIVGLVLSDDFYNKIIVQFPGISAVSKNQLLLLAVSVFFLVIVLKNAFGLLINRIQVNFVQGFYISSSVNVLNKIYSKSYTELQKEPSAKLSNKLSGMQIGIANNTTLAVISIISETMIFIITSAVLVFWNWQLFLLMLCVIVPVMGGFYSSVKRTIKEAGVEKNTIIARLFAKTQEMIFGYADIKIAGTEENYKEEYKLMVENFGNHQKKLNFINFLPTKILELAVFLCIITILVYSVFVLKDTTQIITTISLFSVVAYRSIPSVNRFVMALTQLHAHEYILSDADFFPASAVKKQTSTHPFTFNNVIRFDHVSYRYPSTNIDVLKDCDLEIKRGEKIGIIGKSGAGKSTIINNILGFLHPTGGRILIDNTPLTEDNVEDWWIVLGYVRQDVFILNNTLLENIILGQPAEDVNYETLQRAIKLASLDGLVASWPNGINTMLGERGNKLSGGQKQRIAIARAIYKGADVLIFDEATSSLDSETEEEITNSIQALGHENLTIIIIAHRYTSLKYCDKIYRLEKGKITERINYETLVREVSN